MYLNNFETVIYNSISDAIRIAWSSPITINDINSTVKILSSGLKDDIYKIHMRVVGFDNSIKPVSTLAIKFSDLNGVNMVCFRSILDISLKYDVSFLGLFTQVNNDLLIGKYILVDNDTIMYCFDMTIENLNKLPAQMHNILYKVITAACYLPSKIS